MCQWTFDQCNSANVGNALGQANCTKSIFNKCGTLDPNNVTFPATTTSAGSSGSASASAKSSATTSSHKAAAPTNVQHYGNGAAAVAIGLFAYLL